MAFEAKDLAALIENEHHAAIAARPALMAKAGEAAPPVVTPANFCALWAQAKPILSLVSGIIIFIPGAGTGAGAVLAGLIKIGDQISAQVCHTTN